MSDTELESLADAAKIIADYQRENNALRAKLEKVEETCERNHRIFVKFKIESEAEIAALRATLEALK